MLPGSNHFGYAWIGGGLAIAYGTLCQAERTGDETAKQEAVSAVQFFVRNAHAGVDGLYYGEYAGDSREWGGLASRQYAENLTHLASLSELGQRMKLPEADEWLAALKRGGEFLLRSPKHKGLFPKGWTVDGKAADWPAAGEPPVSSLSAAGAFCVVPLAKLAIMTGDARYRAAAAEAMDAYWREFGETLAAPPWGATLDAGSEDKEAAWGMMGAALETYAATLEPKFLQMAKDAADLTLTWMYFHDVGLYFRPQSPLLHDHVNTIGWTFISTQNQEIDCFGYYMAPDYYRLGLLTGDDRYKQIGRVMFEACIQTISRPGAMFGKVPGIQAEHYNQTNCTYVGGQPGSWRGGSQLTLGIGWITSAALYGGTRLSEMAPDQFWLGP